MSDVDTATINENEESVQEEDQIHLPEGDSSLTNALLTIFGIDERELAALGEVNVSQLKDILWSTLKEKSFGISTALLAFVPFIGEYFLAGKAVYAEGEKVKEAIIAKIKSQIPHVKISEVTPLPKAEIEMKDLSIPKATAAATPIATAAATPIATPLSTRGGSRKRNPNAILRRIEKSKKAFHNTNKSNATFGKGNATFGKTKKPRKTRRLQRGRRVTK
jgi:hypothetical protein